MISMQRIQNLLVRYIGISMAITILSSHWVLNQIVGFMTINGSSGKGSSLRHAKIFIMIMTLKLRVNFQTENYQIFQLDEAGIYQR